MGKSLYCFLPIPEQPQGAPGSPRVRHLASHSDEAYFERVASAELQQKAESSVAGTFITEASL